MPSDESVTIIKRTSVVTSFFDTTLSQELTIPAWSYAENRTRRPGLPKS